MLPGFSVHHNTVLWGGRGGGWSCLLPYGLAVRRQKVPTVIRAFLDMFLKKTILFYGFFWSFSSGNDVGQVLISHMEGPSLLPFVGSVNFLWRHCCRNPQTTPACTIWSLLPTFMFFKLYNTIAAQGLFPLHSAIFVFQPCFFLNLLFHSGLFELWS